MLLWQSLDPGPVTPSTMQHLTPSQYILQQQGVIRVQQILGKLLLRLSFVTILSSVTTIFVERIFEGIRPSCLHEQQSFILIFGGDNLESSSSGFPCVDGNTAILSTSYNLQHLTPSHNTIHHQGAGQQEELCTIIPGYHPGNMELIYFWSPQIFLQRMEGWWERHEMGGKCRACFVHFNILTCCRVPPRFPGNRGHSMLTLIL